MIMTMKNPPHPGFSVRQNCIEPLGLTITEAASPWEFFVRSTTLAGDHRAAGRPLTSAPASGDILKKNGTEDSEIIATPTNAG